jgi:heme/copper-type cytochrome/quinol oxidase subunit 2
MTPVQTPSIFAPVSTPAFAIRELSFFVLGLTAVIFIVVAGFAIYTLIRFGRRPANPGLEPAPGGGNMPAYGKNLSPAEVNALVAFMETLRP